MTQPGEDDLLKGILEGDELVIKFIYQKSLPAVIKYVNSNSGTVADAEDIFQEALIVIYEKLREENLQLKSSLFTFIFAICKNLWLKILRRKNRGFVQMADADIISDENLIESVENSEKYLLFRKYFQKLDARCQQIISLFISGTETEEVMSITGYSNSHVRKKRFECKKKLIEMIEKDPAFQEHIHTSIRS